MPELDVGVVLPQGLDFTMPLNAPDTIQWTQNLQDPMTNINKLNPDLHDWRLERNGVALSAGIFPPNGLQIDTNDRNMQVSGTNWLGYFSQSYMDWDPTQEANAQSLTFTSTDLFDVTRQLIDFVIGGPNSIPITFGNEKSGVLVDQQFLASDMQDLLTMVQDLAQLVNGFDFWIDPDCKFHMAAPHRGIQSSLVLAYGKNIEQVTWQNQGLRSNNVIAVGTGTGNTQIVRMARSIKSQASSREYSEVAQFSNLTNPNQINSLALTELALAKQDQVTITVVSRPFPGENHWAMATVGDYIWIDFDLEYVRLNEYHRCTQIELQPTDQGDEIITYTFAPQTVNTGE